MQGHFDLTLLNTPGLTQELIEAVRQEGGDPKVEALLREFKREGEWKTDNLIYQITPGYLFVQAISGPTPYFLDLAYSTLACINLATTAAEPTYNSELYTTAYIGWESVADSAGIGTGKSKRFINDCIVTPDFKIDAAGREAIYGKFKWLFLPGQATSSVIRSVAVYGSPESNLETSARFCRVGRVRIKDSGGNPVTISKASTRSLLVEYTFTMPTM